MNTLAIVFLPIINDRTAPVGYEGRSAEGPTGIGVPRDLHCDDNAVRVARFGDRLALGGILVWGRPPRTRFVSSPIANDTSALLGIVRPVFRERVIGDFIALYTEGGADHGGWRDRVIGVDCLFEKVTDVFRGPASGTRLQASSTC